jgi:ubiquinone/menaquinone biosynthesis C-methylase UbiE
MEDIENEKINSLWNKEIYYQLIENAQKAERIENKLVVNKIADLIKSENIKKIIDVGCGEGSTIQDVRKITGNIYTEFLGLDVAEIGIARARKKMINNTDFQLYDGKQIPSVNNYFDLSISTFVFEHLEKPEEIFTEMVRVTKKGGYVLIFCPNYGSPFFRSPCNKKNSLGLMIGRLIKSMYPRRYFNKSFQWDKVEPIKLSADQYVTDYDTLIEPNLLYFKKYLLENNKKYELIEANSFWNKYKYGGQSLVKKFFLQIISFLGKKNFFVIKYCGPFFFVVLKKITD